jgi:hypothetical protein
MDEVTKAFEALGQHIPRCGNAVRHGRIRLSMDETVRPGFDSDPTGLSLNDVCMRNRPQATTQLGKDVNNHLHVTACMSGEGITNINSMTAMKFRRFRFPAETIFEVIDSVESFGRRDC